jgi:hypothetical protein
VALSLLSSVIAALIVILVYVWFVSVGYWTWWPKTTYTYDLLGSAFRSGQLSLQEAPTPALLALPDPYDPAARVGIQYPWDASLYGGRYYLYWGPTPGLFLAAIKLFYAGQIADQYLVFSFVSGLYVFSCLLLLSLWRRYYRFQIPAGVVFLSFLALGLAGPATWLLNRPAGYEAAIAGGQFLFIAGLYLAVSGLLYDSPSATRLFLAGICWALALGSRISILFPIAVMTLVISIWLVRFAPAASAATRQIAALSTPLVLGAAALAWYNWARFGSPAEFGLRYQLTLIDFNALYDQAFSVRYIADNLHNYLANLVAVGRAFPFVTPLAPARIPAGPALNMRPADLEPVTGLLVSSPYLVYALVPLAALLQRARHVHAVKPVEGDQSAEDSPRWLYAGLVGCAAISFLFILAYFYPTMRQLEDVVPVMALLAIMGFWEGWRYSRHRTLSLIVYALAGFVLMLISILLSSLLAVTSYDDRFLHLNRELLRQLIRFFGR